MRKPRKLTNEQVLELLSEAGQHGAAELNHGIQERLGVAVNIVVVIEPVGTEDVPNAILLAGSIDAETATDFQGTVRRVLEKGYQTAVSRPPDSATASFS